MIYFTPPCTNNSQQTSPSNQLHNGDVSTLDSSSKEYPCLFHMDSLWAQPAMGMNMLPEKIKKLFTNLSMYMWYERIWEDYFTEHSRLKSTWTDIAEQSEEIEEFKNKFKYVQCKVSFE